MTNLASHVKPSAQVIRLSLGTGMLFICLGGLCAPVRAQTQTAAKRDPASRALPMEDRLFEQIRKPNEDDTPGVLKYGGYHWGDVNVTQRSYRAVGRKIGGATVETIEHSSSYPYVIKDFFGTFRAVAAGPKNYRRPIENTELVGAAVSEANGQWRFVNWTTADGTASERICVFVEPKGERAFGGIVGWYDRENGRVKTVMIRFDQLDGVPVQIIDEYLKKHPSAVLEADFHGETWVADDVRKWVHLMRLLRSDRERFRYALARLAAYDRKLFGMDAKRLEAADETAFEEAVEELSRRAEQWLRRRQAKKRQGKDD